MLMKFKGRNFLCFYIGILLFYSTVSKCKMAHFWKTVLRVRIWVGSGHFGRLDPDFVNMVRIRSTAVWEMCKSCQRVQLWCNGFTIQLCLLVFYSPHYRYSTNTFLGPRTEAFDSTFTPSKGITLYTKII